MFKTVAHVKVYMLKCYKEYRTQSGIRKETQHTNLCSRTRYFRELKRKFTWRNLKYINLCQSGKIVKRKKQDTASFETRVAEEKDLSLKCVICLTDFEADKPVFETTCNHVFHPICMKRAFENNQKHCPICRRELSDKTILVETVTESEIIRNEK